MSKPVPFADKILLPADVENIYVVCSSKGTKKYKNIHYMVVDKKPRAFTSKKKRKEIKKDFSILLFGIDSISRQNFLRKLPKTREYIEKRGWLPLEGYTKTGYNTFPNLIAVLTGMTVEQLTNVCFSSGNDEVDDCPFIWKLFSKKGYLTAYIEDTANVGTFNYEKYGFMNNPTDYYSRPIMQAARKLLSKKENGGMEYCIGQYPQIEYLFQFMTEFVQRFSDRKYFNLFWANSFSHNSLNMPSVMDDRVKTFLEDIENSLNSTVVIFFSDHGMRFGPIRQTFVGWLEERMPFIYFHLPPSFKERYPLRYQNLVANKNKLTSPFDLHATLQHLLSGKVHQSPTGCPQCDSLLAPVPHNRSCADAGITSEWCTCSVSDGSESTSDLRITAAAHLAIDSINELLKDNKDKIKRGYQCAALSLEKIISVRSKISGGFLLGNQRREFIITFRAKPSGAVFEITVPASAIKAINVNEISRINIYGDESACIGGTALLKLFCFCAES